MNKNPLKSLGVALMVAMLTPYAAHASNAQDAQVGWFDATANADQNAGAANNQAQAVNLAYIGSSTEAVVTISATAMTVYAPAGVVDSAVGTSGVITFASTLGSNTMGALCDYLNGKTSALVNYKCRLLDSKRDDVPGLVLKTQTGTSGTNDLKGIGGANILITTNTYVSLGIQPAAGKRVKLKQCRMNNAANNDAGNNMHVYGQLRKFGSGKDAAGVTADDTYLVWKSTGGPTPNVVITEPPLTSAPLAWLEFAQDAHVVVRAGVSGNTTTAAQTANNSIGCFWDEL